MKSRVSKGTPRKAGSKRSLNPSRKPGRICYANLEQSKAAGDWVAKKHSGVFRRLAH
jgi:hypothetical protein